MSNCIDNARAYIFGFKCLLSEQVFWLLILIIPDSNPYSYFYDYNKFCIAMFCNALVVPCHSHIRKLATIPREIDTVGCHGHQAYLKM